MIQTMVAYFCIAVHFYSNELTWHVLNENKFNNIYKMWWIDLAQICCEQINFMIPIVTLFMTLISRVILIALQRTGDGESFPGSVER